MSKHTPGPWKICEYKGEFYVADRHAIALWNDNGALYNLEDGRLMASAPEMLEMLKELEFPVNDGSGFHVLCRFCQGRMEHAPDCKLGKLLKEADG